jgi:signal transduction histidine kinase
MPAAQDTFFARLVSLACHDLRTPLATVSGFARTLTRQAQLPEPASRYVEMIEAAAGQISELVDELTLAARIEARRYDPTLRATTTLALVHAAAGRLDEKRVRVSGDGAMIDTDVVAAERAIAALIQCALRHGGLDEVRVVAEETIEIAPITPASAPVVLGEDLRDLGAAVAVQLVRALGGSVALEADTLRVRLRV